LVLVEFNYGKHISIITFFVNFQVTYSSNKIIVQVWNTYCFVFDHLPLNQKQKWLENWI